MASRVLVSRVAQTRVVFEILNRPVHEFIDALPDDRQRSEEPLLRLNTCAEPIFQFKIQACRSEKTVKQTLLLRENGLAILQPVRKSSAYACDFKTDDLTSLDASSGDALIRDSVIFYQRASWLFKSGRLKKSFVDTPKLALLPTVPQSPETTPIIPK